VISNVNMTRGSSHDSEIPSLVNWENGVPYLQLGKLGGAVGFRGKNET
jgi:hypothetical protein